MREFLRHVFSEESGKWSFARVTTAIILVNELAWVWFILLHGDPPTLPELAGLALFLTPLYLVNKAGSAATDIGTGTREPSAK